MIGLYDDPGALRLAEISRGLNDEAEAEMDVFVIPGTDDSTLGIPEY